MNFFSRGDHMCYYCVVCWLVNLVYSKVTNWSEIIITRPLQEPQNQHGGLHSISFFGRPSKILADSFCIHNCFEIVNIFLRYLVCRQFFWPRFKIRSWSLSTISRVDTSEGIADRATCWILNLFIFSNWIYDKHLSPIVLVDFILEFSSAGTGVSWRPDVQHFKFKHFLLNNQKQIWNKCNDSAN